MQRQLWAERMNVYSSFGGTLTEARRGEYEWWHRCNEAPESPDQVASRTDARAGDRGTDLPPPEP